jgi:hypothetical protein
MARMITSRQLIGFLLTAAVLSACGKSGAPSGSGDQSGDQGNISGSASPGGPAPGGPRLVTPVPGLESVHPAGWEKATAQPGGASLTVAFWSSPCLDVDRVALAEDASRVVVALYLGTPAAGSPQPCVQSAEYRAVRVALSAPLGSRTVVDGAPGAGQAPAGPGTSVGPSPA